MAAYTDITTGEQTVSATGAITGTLDVSGLSGDYTVKIMVRGLSASKYLLLALEDTVNAFTATVQRAAKQFAGGMPTDGQVFSIPSREIPLSQFGITSGTFRINTLAISSTPGTVKVHAWIEQ